MITVFAREITDDLTSLVKEIDRVVGEKKDKKAASFVVLLSEDPDATEAKLKTLASKEKIKNTPLTVFEGVAGPKNYKISKDAAVTVVMWEKHEVKVNHAFDKSGFNKDAVKAIVMDAEKMLQ